MAEDTRMKELMAEVNRLKDLSETMNKMVEALDVQDKEMKKLMELLAACEKDRATRFETLESNLDSLLRLGGTHNTASFEQFFFYYHTPDDQRLTIVAIHLYKEVVHWF
ncbi:hypothetical protein VIGAN_04133100 [Vigna angularis var. angularis]|uniref:Uncharacterized protein n=1 Tax=Vigna angularis var. angularis TaxID=157739 RepID=A0A0S3RU87_PHAAN|nr:hypothetical protein VIGAN_04133100 [Vigna angularis var. angularis]